MKWLRRTLWKTLRWLPALVQAVRAVKTLPPHVQLAAQLCASIVEKAAQAEIEAGHTKMYGEEKFNMALSRLKSELALKGLRLSESAQRSALEWAVDKANRTEWPDPESLKRQWQKIY